MPGAPPPVESAEQIAPQADWRTADNEDDALFDTVRRLSSIQSDFTLFLMSSCVYNAMNQGARASQFHYSPPPSVIDDEHFPRPANQNTRESRITFYAAEMYKY